MITAIVAGTVALVSAGAAGIVWATLTGWPERRLDAHRPRVPHLTESGYEQSDFEQFVRALRYVRLHDGSK